MMFCQSCGTSNHETANYCKSCGISLTNTGKKKDGPFSCSINSQQSDGGGKNSTSQAQPLSFKAYMEGRNLSTNHTFATVQKRKSDERSKSIKKRVKTNEIVQITIGIAEIDSTGRQLKIRRGSLLPVDVKKSDSHVVVKNLGLEKQLAHNKKLRECDQCEWWVLLYPDFDLVLTLPGTSKPFSVEHYKESIGRPYSRVSLYLCKLSDYESANDLESDLDSHLENENTTGVDSSGQQITTDAEAIQAFVEISNLTDLHGNVDVEQDVLSMPIDICEGDLQLERQVIQEVIDDGDFVLNVDDSPRLISPREIAIPRSNLLNTMILEFNDPAILQCKLTFVIIGDNGTPEKGRGVGVTRDVLSLFWKDFSISLAIGAAEKVPSIRHDYQKSQWLSIARIIVFGFREENYFPIFLSKAFTASCLYGEEALSKECFLDSFYAYVSKDEQEILKKCLKGEIEVNDEDVLDLLSSYSCYRLPTQESIQNIVEELAHQELVQRPKYISMAWSLELEKLKRFPEFCDFGSMCAMYEEKKPTSKRIIKLLHAEPSSDPERTCFEHLKRYIKSLEDSRLAGFLQFVTGSNIITVKKIEVAFTNSAGLARCIVAHTCGPLLELPSTFQTYNELSEEFSNTLVNTFAWSFIIV